MELPFFLDITMGLNLLVPKKTGVHCWKLVCRLTEETIHSVMELQNITDSNGWALPAADGL